MDNILTINALTKNYGRIRALDGFDLEVNKGVVFGLLGPNGSGKTTTLSILLDIVKPDRGSFRWFEEPPSHHSRKRIGATLEYPVFYPYLSAVRNMKIIARIKEKPFGDFEEILKLVGLYDRKDDKFRTYSMGMKQRLAIASALIGNPEVLILDEPTNGLDPQGIADIRNLVIRIANEGKTIILASHLLDEVQKMCSHVAVLKRGKRLFAGPVGEVLVVADTIELAAADMKMLTETLIGFRGVRDIRREGEYLTARLDKGVLPEDVNKYLASQGVVLSHLAMRKRSLEEQFLELLKEGE